MNTANTTGREPRRVNTRKPGATPLTESDIDAAIRRDRTTYDRAECNVHWLDTADLEAQALADDMADMHRAATAPLTGAGRQLGAAIVAVIAAAALAIAWHWQP